MNVLTLENGIKKLKPLPPFDEISSRNLSTSSNITLTDSDVPIQYITVSGGPIDLQLPDPTATTFRFFKIYNISEPISGSTRIRFLDESGSFITSIRSGEVFYCHSNGTVWSVHRDD